MNVLLVHNYYKQRGGEDESFESELELLRSHGHSVRTYTRHNDEIDTLSRTKVSRDLYWNRKTIADICGILKTFRADVLHCTNLFPLISASAYRAAQIHNVPVVQSLRNYRHLCLNSFFFRKGQICERCIKKTMSIPGIVNGCYKGSVIGSAILAGHNAYHSFRKTNTKLVDLFFTPTEFARDKYIEAGWPADKITVKPNFLANSVSSSNGQRTSALFVGRLSEEKGVRTLVDTWINNRLNTPLQLVGDGFLERFLIDIAKTNQDIDYSGRVDLADVQKLMSQAKFLIIPSEWYETFGRTIMEAFASGTPVIASNLGAMAELVQHEHNGLLFDAGNKDQLASAINRLDNDTELCKRLGENALKTFKQKYSASANHRLLTNIYESAISASNSVVKFA